MNMSLGDIYAKLKLETNVQNIFLDIFFFKKSDKAGKLTTGLTYFLFWLRFGRVEI